MTLHNILGLVCSVGMFLLGIDLMGDGLRAACGEGMRRLLSACTKNRLLGLLTGLAVTAVIQSSSATTVMVVSFIDSGLMELSQAVGVIMGANIGTTATSLLIAVNFSAIAPLAVFAGTVIKMFAKSDRAKAVGIVIAGFGLLFAAMSSMSSFMSFFKDNGSADALIAACDGKLRGVLVGFAITAIMQSSSATVGILQSAANSGLVSTQTAVYILLGQNIGAVIPTLLSSIKANSQAKKAAVVHLLFNVAGTLIFFVICQFTPYCALLDRIESGSMRVSAAHIIFNVVSAVVLFPFAGKVAEALNSKRVGRLQVV